MADRIRLADSDDDENVSGLSDSEDEYSEEEKEILAEVRRGRQKDDGKQELLAFADSDDEEDDEGQQDEDDEDDLNEMMGDSDIEGAEDNDDDLPDATDWGKNKRNYYNTDFVDPDFDTYNAEQEEMALAEEEEAKAIQQRLAKQMNEDDFNLEEMFPAAKVAASDSEEEPAAKKKKVIKTQADFANLSKREKQQLFQKDSPEFQGLVTDYENYFSEVANLIVPVMDYVKENNLPKIPAFEYAEFFKNVALMYCTNITYYLLLKAKRIPIKHHPVTKRLVQYKNLLNELQDRHENIIRPQLEALLERIEDGDEFTINDPLKKTKKRILNIMKAYDEEDLQNVTKDEDLGSDGESGSAAEEEDDGVDEEADEFGDEGEVEGDSRRGITYQIAKNKGLTPHRKKELRNPRVKHRSKYRKALIRRKGAVRTVRKELKRYDGEISGIKATVSKSIKIKV